MSNLTNLTEEQKAHRRLEALAKSSRGKVVFKTSNLSLEEKKKLDLSCEYFDVILRRTMLYSEMVAYSETDTQDPRKVYIYEDENKELCHMVYSYTTRGWVDIEPPILTYQYWASNMSMKYNSTTKAWDEPHLIDKLGRSGWVEVEVKSTAKRERWLANPY